MTPNTDKPLRIGTRRSPLALTQANMVADALLAAHGWTADRVRLVPMLASGDKIQDRPLAEIGGKALWTKELERALIDDEIDIAVHSMKDVETIRPDSFAVTAMLPRADVRDRLIGAVSIDALPQGARVGTSSPRRAAQLLALRPDLVITPLRGNVATRLAHIEAGHADATLLAAAGLDRLGMGDVGYAVPTDLLLPAASQGAIGIDRLTARTDLQPLLDVIDHRDSFAAVTAERAFLEALGGNCHSPVAALAVVEAGGIRLTGQLLSETGGELHGATLFYPPEDVAAPARLAAQLLALSSADIRRHFSTENAQP